MGMTLTCRPVGGRRCSIIYAAIGKGVLRFPWLDGLPEDRPKAGLQAVHFHCVQAIRTAKKEWMGSKFKCIATHVE